MSDKPWEGRSVWCSGEDDKSDGGWIEVRERDAQRVELEITDNRGFSKSIVMARDQAKTFAAHMLNLAGRSR